MNSSLPANGVSFGKTLGVTRQPNPASQEVVVRLQGHDGGAGSLVLHDLLGQAVYRQAIGEGEFEVRIGFSENQLNHGKYFVRVVTGAGTVTQQLVIVR